jgi:PAS domain S-box-containing protein
MNERPKNSIEATTGSERGFHTLADYAPVMLWLAEVHGGRSYFNQFWLNFTGCGLEQEIGERWENGVHPDDRASYRKAYETALKANAEYRIEYRLRRADGEFRWILENGAPIRGEDGKPAGFIGSGIDITDRKCSEEALLQNQEHIATLNSRLRESMKETHHRVKNSLQMIAAMIDLRLMDAAALVPASELRQLGLHINSLAVVHELLTDQARQDGLGDYLAAKDLLERLLPVLQALAGSRPLRFDIADVRLSARQANALPLVTNELVSNALKHGQGEVGVTLTIVGYEAVLEVTDEGPGFPLDFDPRRVARTGLELVERLTRWDLSGTIRYENRDKGGARVALALPFDSFH